MNALVLASSPTSKFMMSTREIATIVEKQHKFVVRDTKAMVIELYAEEIVKRTIPAGQLTRPSEFIREKADIILAELFGDGSNWSHPSGGIVCERDVRGYVSFFHLDFSHAVTLAAGYSTPLRKRIIDRWMELEAERRQSVAAPDDTRIAELEARVAALEAKPAPLRIPAKPGAAERICEFVRKRGSVTKSDILRQFRDVSAAECSSALHRLQSDGRIVVVMIASGEAGKPGGRPAAHCRWLQ